MQFVPLWTSILRSRKVANLSDELYRTWTLCLLTAQEHDHKNGSLPSVDDFSYAIHMEPKSLMSRLSRLVTLRFLDVRDGIYYVHDWDDWKHRPDPTGAARKRAQRDREREEKEAAEHVREGNGVPEASNDVTVTGVTSQKSQCHAPTHLTSPQQHITPLPPETGGCECEEVEPFQSEVPPPPPEDLPPDKQRVLARQTQRFGASNGDRIFRDLLRDYSAAIVEAAGDFHFADASGQLWPKRLTGICREMAAGRWKTPDKSKGRETPYRSKVVEAPLPPSARVAKGPSINAAEALRIMKGGGE